MLSTAAGAAAAAPAAGERAVLLDAGAYFFALLPDGAGVGATFATLVLLGIRRFARLTRARWSEIRVHRTRTALKRRRPGLLCASRGAARTNKKQKNILWCDVATAEGTRGAVKASASGAPPSTALRRGGASQPARVVEHIAHLGRSHVEIPSLYALVYAICLGKLLRDEAKLEGE